MRFVLLILGFILLSSSASSYWQTYQNDLRNSGTANGTGFFPLATANFSNGIFGMDFQPLIADINNDSYTEIIIFSNDFLKVFDHELNLVEEKFTGAVLGQPAIFNSNIIFNSRIDGRNYFFAYQYNNSVLAPRFNISLSNDADFGGIKCLNLNGSDSCVFKDKLNYVHIVNVGSKTDNSYKASGYNETRQTVPAIGDIDGDGSQEAVFWLNNDSINGYGFLAFDLAQRNVKWTVDNIFSPLFGNPSSSVLKGNPVLVDLNNDGKLEIAASVFYSDNTLTGDWYTELFVYNYNGAKLFSKCELNPLGNCNDGLTKNDGHESRWEGTNPFVIDINNDGADDICFIKDKKISMVFKNMTINCYNYSGDVILDSELSPSTDTVKTAIVADMNNDGSKDIVTENNIYAQNGTSIFSYDLSSNFAIPADVDNNNHLDLVWTKNGAAKLFVDDKGTIKVSDVLIKPENPSADDSLSCSWKIYGNNKIISANASWHKNGIFYSSEIADCINGTLCTAAGTVPSSELNEDDAWKCSVAAFDNTQKSLPKSDLATIFGRSSEWKGFSKNRLSYGIAPGSGYFSKSAITALIYNSSGTEFQPMAADADNNGENEIVVFSNNSLILFNKNLNILAQKQVGNLRGQFDAENMDNDAFIEIIAVVNSSSMDNFTIFEFNGSDFKIEASFDVTSQNGFQDIRCLDFDKDNAKECIFRDYNGIVHSYHINAANQSDDGLNINISDREDNVYGSSANLVPSFADFDRDNDLDALFWFNDNFIVIDSNKNVVLNADAGTLNSIFQNEPALLGAKFVNLDKAGDYEIAAAYRHDYQKGPSFKTDINLSLFNSKGKPIFYKIIDFYNVNPCSNGNIHCFGIGSDLIVYDYNKDGFDDIGIYAEGAGSSPFGAFIKFFDRNGDGIASNKVEPGEGAGIPQSVTLADIDGDNNLDLILRKRIYNIDGTVLYNFTDTAVKAPIAVDIDKNKGLDLLWFNSNKLILLLDNSSMKPDFSVEEKDILFSPLNSTSALVAATIHNNGNLNANNVKVKLTNTETLESADGIISIKGNSMNNFTAVLNLKKRDKVLVQANYDDSIEESNDKNNFAYREFNALPYVFVSADLLEPFNAESEFKDYIKNKLASGYYTENENEANIKVYIGKNNPRNRDSSIKTLNDFGFGYDYGSIIHYDQMGTLPYNGMASVFKDFDGILKVMIVGNEIEGAIAAAKEFIKNQALFLSAQDKYSVFIDDENADAIKIFDYLHLGGNAGHYMADNNEFKQIVKNALNDNMFSIFDKSVASGNGITLRLRNLKPNIGSDYLEYLSSNGVPVEMPVVLARGIHSNLTTWETLAGEIANEGRDAWLIEITGGPGQDCDECPNYNFSDLIDDYWPALINGVLNFTGKDKIQYVGHSNGGRVAIVSLADGAINPGKIDTLIGVGVPSAFDGYSTFGFYFGKYGEQIMKELENKSHVSLTEIGEKLRRLCLSNFEIGCGILTIGLKSENKMSFNTDKQYYLWITNTTDEQIGKNLQLSNFYLIQGWVSDDKKNVTHDFIVTGQDERAIYNNILSSNKKHYKVWGAHTAGWNAASLPDRGFTKSIIKDALNKKTLTKYKSNEINST